MHQLLIYADSLTWGIIPGTRNRLPFEHRWPGVLEDRLNASGSRVRVIEDCLNGRRTVWDDPFKPGRNGLLGLAQTIEKHSPLALVILMLGTNDFQFCHPHNNAWSAAQGITALVNAIRTAPIEPGMPVPQMIVVCPPPLHAPHGTMAEKFAGGDTRCAGLADAYRQVCTAMNCHFFDAGSLVRSSDIDGVHLDRDQHQVLGHALARDVSGILGLTAHAQHL